MRKWKFVQLKDNGPWYLEVNDIETLLRYHAENKSFEKDKAHFLKLQNFDDRPAMIEAHTEYGWLVYKIKSMGFNTNEAYQILSELQLESMTKVLKNKGSILINRRDGFCINKAKNPHFVYRKDLEWPRYLNNDIRIKRFDDGTHYYAYIGDTQVKKGETIKWNTWDEAYEAAKTYTCK